MANMHIVGLSLLQLGYNVNDISPERSADETEPG